MDSLFGLGARGVVATTICIIAASWLFGAGIHLLLKRLGLPMRGAALTVGTGLVGAAFTMQTGYLVAGNAFIFLVLAASGSLGYSLFALTAAVRGDQRAREALRSLTPSATDWMTGIVVPVALYPLVRMGLVYYTTFINDFPNYAASAQQWLSSSGVGPEFLEKHPDNFGTYQLFRAEGEKPASTATFVFATVVTGVPGYALLGPIIVVTVMLLVGNLAATVRRLFPIGPLGATAAALAPALSIVPMSRLHDAQVGQAIAVAFLAVLVHASVLISASAGRAQVVAGTILGGALLTATVGANPTLILGSGISWGALVLWMSNRSGAPWKPTLQRFAGAGALAVVFSIPAFEGYRISLREQTGGGQGYDLPVPGPLAAIGLQLDISDVAGTAQVLLAWFAVGAALLALTVVLSRTPSYWITVGLLGAVVANGMLIAAATGIDNYATHKWEALVIPIVVPFLVARAADLAPPGRRMLAEASLVALAVGSLAISWRSSGDVPVRASYPVMELANDDVLQSKSVVNVDLRDLYANSIAVMSIPSSQVILVGDAYSDPSPPRGDRFVVTAATAAEWGATDVRPLGGDLVLATIDLAVPSDRPVVFSSEHPETERFLIGDWYHLEPSGVWTRGRYNRVVFDVPVELRGRDVEVHLRGTRLAAKGTTRELIVRLDDLNGPELLREQFSATVPRDLSLTVPGSAVEAGDGRIVLHLDTPRAVRARELGFADDRTLGFMLERLTVAAIAAPSD